jgi:hypothetical protein
MALGREVLSDLRTHAMSYEQTTASSSPFLQCWMLILMPDGVSCALFRRQGNLASSNTHETFASYVLNLFETRIEEFDSGRRRW